MLSSEGGALEGVSPRVFPKPQERRTHEYKKTPLCTQLSFHFLPSFSFRRKEIFPWEHIKLGELPQHNTVGFFSWGRPSKYTQKKKGVVYEVFLSHS
jgi:hypothetical protein